MEAETAELTPPAPLDAGRTSLFLDLDGTLAPIAPHPDDVRADPARSRLLDQASGKLGGRLAVISGRALAEIDRILDGRTPAAAGVHGLERRGADGRVVKAAPHPAIAQARVEARALAAAWPGVLVEDKGLSLALHFRNAPAAANAVTACAETLAAKTGLKLQRGDMVCELLTPGPNKGDALRTFMAEKPFMNGRPVFVGDDLTDETAFEAARALGGFGVLVGPQRATAARWRLADVAAVFDWLADLA